MNFRTAYERGKAGKNIGLPMGIPELDIHLNGIQRKHIYAVAAPPKVGKTTFVDFAFILGPYLNDPTGNYEIIYYSLEIDRITKMFKFAAFFMHYDHGITTFMYDGHRYDMSDSYLLGKLKKHDNHKEAVPVSAEHEALLIKVYVERLEPLFGTYDNRGRLVTKGKMTLIEERSNPTGIWKYLRNIARSNGTEITEAYETTNEAGISETHYRVTGYIPNDPDKYWLVVTDHVRKLSLENKYTIKQNVDKYSSYQVELRNLYGFTFINIIHLNRDLANVNRIKINPEFLYPTGDDIKDTGNLSEDSNTVLTLFDPNDEKYNIHQHFSLPLIDSNQSRKYPYYKSLHLVESREVEAPMHFRLNMYGNIMKFEHLDDTPTYGFS